MFSILLPSKTKRERERERERINLRKPELISAIKENSPSLPYIFLT
jgi:hypothetical protein